MTKVACKFCGKCVNEANMRKHQKTGKCLEHQGIHAKVTHGCDWCGEEFNRADALNRHITTCKQKRNESHTSVEARLREENRALKADLKASLLENAQKDEWLEALQEKLKMAEKEISVLKAYPPVVNITNNNNIRVDKFVVQQYAKDNFTALTDGLLKQCLSVAVDPRLLLRGPEAVAQLILETSLEGKDKMACTDTARSVCFWKERDHTVITDMKMKKLMPRLVRPIYAAYSVAWRKEDDMGTDEFQAIGEVVNRLCSICRGTDVRSKYYNALSRIIMDAKCDLLYMLEAEDEQDRDEDGNSIEWMSSDSD